MTKAKFINELIYKTQATLYKAIFSQVEDVRQAEQILAENIQQLNDGLNARTKEYHLSENVPMKVRIECGQWVRDSLRKAGI